MRGVEFNACMAPDGYVIAVARPDQLPRLAAIERAGADCFPPDVLPAEIRDQVVPLATLEAARADGTLWVASVAGGEPIGYLVGRVWGDELYIAQLDVLAAHQRRGIGRALIERAVEHARAVRWRAITLTTFRSVRWNGPWYQRLGFVELSPADLSPHLQAQLAFENSLGLRDRIAMCRVLRAERDRVPRPRS